MTIQMQAEDFFNAYLVLKENNEVFIERQADSSSVSLTGTKELVTRITGGVEIVCLAFSVELYIKDLYYAVNGETTWGHNILELFNKLPEEIRQEIFACESISQNPFFTRGNILYANSFSGNHSAYNGFIDQIKAISDGFEKWRYSYESKTLHYDISFALAFIDSIKLAAGEVRKRSAVGN